MKLSQEDIKKNYTKKLGQQDKRTINRSKGKKDKNIKGIITKKNSRIK